MSSTVKKVLLILLLLAVTALIGYGLYFAFIKSQTPSVPINLNTGGQTGGSLPTAGNRPPNNGNENNGNNTGSLPAGNDVTLPPQTSYQPAPVTKLTSDYALFPSANNNGQFRYHNAADGKFYHLNPDGSATAMSDQVFYNVNNVTWAPTKNIAVLEYPDNSKIVYNFDSQKQVSLPKHWQEFSFSSDGAELAAKSIGLSPENRFLVTVNTDGTNTKLIEPLGNYASKVIVDWSPSRQTVAFSQTGDPQGADRREVLFVGLNGENFKSAIVEGLDFVPAWSPTGQHLLYSVDSARSNYKPELWITDAYGDSIGGNRHTIGLNTWANKCTFAGENTLYCAVPQSLPDGAGMSPEIAAGTPDDLYKIDLKTGVKTAIPLGGNYSINNINYNAANNTLLFTDSNQSGVFKVSP